MLKIKELQKLTLKELNEEFIKASKDLFKIKFEVNTGSSKANDQISKTRRYRAQIKTVQKELEVKEGKEVKSQKEVHGASDSEPEADPKNTKK